MDLISYQLFKEATTLLKKDDPECIPLFEQVDTFNARAQLASIYLDGKCGQGINYDKALMYTENNPNPVARAIETRIKCFILKEDEDSSKHLEEMIYQHEKYPDQRTVSTVLADMYLWGIGTEIDYETACKINPFLSTKKTLAWELNQMDFDTRKKLEKHLYEIGGPEEITEFVKEFIPRIEKNRLDKNSKIERSRRQEEIDNAINTHVPAKQIEELCIKWFKDDACIKSAYYYIRYVKNTDRNLAEHAIEILDTAEINPKYLQAVVHYYYKKKQWDELKRILEKDKKHNLDFYRAQLYLHEGDDKNAVKYLLASIKEPENGKYSNQSLQSMKLLFEKRPEWIMYYQNYAHAILEDTNGRNRYVAASALLRYGDPANKKKAKEILKKDSIYIYEAAELMYNETGDEIYKDRMNKLSFNKQDDHNYIFNYKDETEVLLSNYKTLSPKWRLTALDELIDRYLNAHRGTQKDYNKAADLLEERIELCEKFNISSINSKAILGAMMFKGQIPCIDNTLMFQYLYAMKNTPPYRNMVIDCLLEGRGTEQNLDEAISLIRSNGILNEWYRLLQLCDRNNDKVEFNELKKELILETINKGRVNKKLIKEFEAMDENRIPSDIELSYTDYNNTKIELLLSEAEHTEDQIYKLRCLDYARRLGNIKACNKEAALLKDHFKNPRLAYSILIDSGMDAANLFMRRISTVDQILVNIDAEIKRMMESDH